VIPTPLGLSLFTPETLDEQNDIHIGCFDNNALIGILILTPVDKETIQMRQVAVEEKQQGKGIGSLLIQCAEKTAREQEFSHIVLSARTTVLDFYRKMGYKTIGEEYISGSTYIPHFKM
jgi:predicted N-acetyltransferase YhbS